MKMIGLVTCFALISTGAVAQSGGPSGPGAITGDPAASSAKPSADPTKATGRSTNPSGSGTSSSGGRDDNGDQGRDKMSESNSSVKPTPAKPNIANPTNSK